MKHPYTLIFALTLITIATATRLLPHPINFTPLLAVALFAGQKLGNRKLGIMTVLGSMLVIDGPLLLTTVIPQSDRTLIPAILLVNGVVYATVAAITWFAGRKPHPRNVATALIGTTTASVSFFILSNLASWLAFYPPTATGLSNCFIQAIPFFKNTWFSTLFYTAILFGCQALFEHSMLARTKFHSERSH